MTAGEPQFDELYRELLLDHYRKPRNRGRLAAPTHHAEGANPVCGDEVRIDLEVEGDVLTDIAFEGQGCSISQSSASMMSEQVKAKPRADIARIKAAFEAMLTNGAEPIAELGDLEALQGVAQFPVRVKCALLPWKVLDEGLNEPTTTGGANG